MHILSAVVAFAMLVGCSAKAPDPRGVGHDEVLLQVSASGRTDTRPDEARFTAGVTTIAASAAAAGAANSAAIARVVAGVEALGIKPDDIRTQSIGLSRIDYGRDTGRFQANNSLDIRIRDLARAGEAVAVVTQAGANLLSGPNLGVADPEAASRSAYAAAYRAARARADTYAKAAGLAVTRVLAIRDGGESPGPNYYSGNMSSRASPPQIDSSAPPVRGGSSTSEVRVHVDFALGAR